MSESVYTITCRCGAQTHVQATTAITAASKATNAGWTFIPGGLLCPKCSERQ